MGRGAFRPRQFGAARPDNRQSVSASRAQLLLLLINCTDERLAEFTAEKLDNMYGVKLRECSSMLDAERERRAARA